MTNGERIKEIFSNIETRLDAKTGIMIVKWADNTTKCFKASWWNAEYKEPNKSEIPTSSTTKNDLGVDCISRADVNRVICEYRDDNAETGSERDLERAYGANAVGALISELPSVTPQEPRWFPCSEKKPDKGGEYLLWGKICDDGEEEYCFIGNYYEFEEKFGIEKSNYDPHTLGFLDTEIDEYYSVKAWMPLPASYEPRESEDKE